jgi:hypothetical protein
MWTGVLIWALACGANALEITRYVKPGGTGKGTSWADACGSINQALAAIKTGGSGTVYVGPGSYTESVYVPNGSRKVSILGGYSENDMEKPDLEKNKVLLSEKKRKDFIGGGRALEVGWESEDILIFGINIVKGDTGMNIEDGATGIYIRGTNIRVDGCNISDCDTGIENEATLKNQKHFITRCKVFNCSRYGVKLHNMDILQTSIYNNALGMYLEGCYVSGCHIFGNVHVSKTTGYTDKGGGIRMYRTTLMRCLIINNRCDGEGGGVYAGGSRGFSFIFACIISNNTSRDGGGIYTDEQTLVESCTIINNKATRFGGGICIGEYGEDNVSAMTGSILWNNTANGVAQQYGIYANKPFNMTCSAIQGGGLLPETDAKNGIIDVSPKNVDTSKPCVALANAVPFSGAATTPEQLKLIATGDFDLTAQSACIDNGGDFSDMKITMLGGSVYTLNADRSKDAWSRPRTDGKYDIGAYEYQKPSPDK